MGNHKCLNGALMVKKNIGIKTSHGKWLSITRDGTVKANSDLPLDREMFEIKAVNSTHVSIRSVKNNRYLCAEEDGRVVCDRTWVRGWEMWKPCQSGDRIGFLSCHGKYLCVEPDGKITADRDELLGWETFILCKVLTVDGHGSAPSGWESIAASAAQTLIIGVILVGVLLGIYNDHEARFGDGEPIEPDDRPEPQDPTDRDSSAPAPGSSDSQGRVWEV